MHGHNRAIAYVFPSIMCNMHKLREVFIVLACNIQATQYEHGIFTMYTIK